MSADDIYREDVVFRDPRNCFRGMKNYQTIFWSLRFHGNLFFKDLYVEVKRIWQKTDDTICLRWTVRGFPRLPWDQEGTFDGVSTYKLDSHGKVRCTGDTACRRRSCSCAQCVDHAWRAPLQGG